MRDEFGDDEDEESEEENVDPATIVISARAINNGGAGEYCNASLSQTL